MKAGFIYGKDYEMSWLPENEKLFLGMWVVAAERIQYRKTNSLFRRPRIKSYKCTDCKKMVIDLNEN